ncbi:hypothetical protein C8J56DRAFT_1069026 [Mycena floridula]|nr:hypothetical protein C8J56DRAFT_1069026 [Mycena floridula]
MTQCFFGTWISLQPPYGLAPHDDIDDDIGRKKAKGHHPRARLDQLCFFTFWLTVRRQGLTIAVSQGRSLVKRAKSLRWSRMAAPREQKRDSGLGGDQVIKPSSRHPRQPLWRSCFLVIHVPMQFLERSHYSPFPPFLRRPPAISAKLHSTSRFIHPRPAQIMQSRSDFYLPSSHPFPPLPPNSHHYPSYLLVDRLLNGAILNDAGSSERPRSTMKLLGEGRKQRVIRGRGGQESERRADGSRITKKERLWVNRFR